MELGFKPDRLFVAAISLTSVKYESDDAKTVAFWDDVLTKIRQMPGVMGAGMNENPPLNGERWDVSPFTVDGQPKPEPGHEPVLTPVAVSSGYFRTMQIPILQGRDFNAEDTADKSNVVIVNAPLAEHFFPGQNPIGKSIRIFYTGSTQCTIVGVVPYVCERTPGEDEIPFQAYQPYTQLAPNRLDLVIRSELSSSSLFASVRHAVASVDSGVPIYDATSYKEMIAEQFVARRLSTLLVVLFSGATLFLSAAGLYGVLAYFVGQKTREIGIGSSSLQYLKAGGQARSMASGRRFNHRDSSWPITDPLHRGAPLRCICLRSRHAVADRSRAWDRLAVSLSVAGAESDTDQPDESFERIATVQI